MFVIAHQTFSRGSIFTVDPGGQDCNTPKKLKTRKLTHRCDESSLGPATAPKTNQNKNETTRNETSTQTPSNLFTGTHFHIRFGGPGLQHFEIWKIRKLTHRSDESSFGPATAPKTNQNKNETTRNETSEQTPTDRKRK